MRFTNTVFIKPIPRSRRIECNCTPPSPTPVAVIQLECKTVEIAKPKVKRTLVVFYKRPSLNSVLNKERASLFEKTNNFNKNLNVSLFKPKPKIVIEIKLKTRTHENFNVFSKARGIEREVPVVVVKTDDIIDIPDSVDVLINNVGTINVDTISHIKVLSREEERELIHRANALGDIKARDKIIEHNLRLVAYIAKAYAKNEYIFNELYAEGYAILFHAITKFDLSMNTKFSTYATWWIRQAMSKYLNGKNTEGEIPEIEIECNHRDSFEANEIIKLVRDCLFVLTDREADIIRRRFGINCEEETLDEIGCDYDLSKERIRQIQEKAMEKMKPLLKSCI